MKAARQCTIRLPLTRIFLVAALIFAFGATGLPGTAQTNQIAVDVTRGQQLFQQKCAACHDPAEDRAPDRRILGQYNPTELIAIITSGAMAPMAQGLSESDRASIAAFLKGGGRAVAGDGNGQSQIGLTQPADNLCNSNPHIRATGSDWPNWGLEPSNAHFQLNPGFQVSDIPKLQLKWAFSYRGDEYGQPMVVGDWLFITSSGGNFFALDAKTGCVRWDKMNMSARSTPLVVRSDISPSGWVIYMAEQNNRLAHAFDAETGQEIWKSQPLDLSGNIRIQGPVALYKDTLLIPLATNEWGIGVLPKYPCCFVRGSVVALNARTGTQLWKTYTVDEPLHNTRVNSAGVQMQGPAGGSIWSAPAIDTKRGVIYVGTGQSYTDADTKGTDALIAIDIATGKKRWTYQAASQDSFLVGCPSSGSGPTNCPSVPGMDGDLTSPVIFGAADGKQVVVSGSKTGWVYGVDPDRGELIWKVKLGAGSTHGGVMWGSSADSKNVLVQISDSGALQAALGGRGGRPYAGAANPPTPGLYALDPVTGRVVWKTPTPALPCLVHNGTSRGACVNAEAAVTSVIPGAIFSGTVDGWLRAYDSRDGKIVWAYNTAAQTYDTVNGVKGQPGGSIDAMGPTVAGGMVYTMSGYDGSARNGGNGVNVLLAFSINGN